MYSTLFFPGGVCSCTVVNYVRGIQTKFVKALERKRVYTLDPTLFYDMDKLSGILYKL